MANDTWRTPPEVIDYIENRFGKIALDLCASDAGHVCENYITHIGDFLSHETLMSHDGSIHGDDLSWMNPPYSNPLPFVKQAIKWSEMGYAVAGILNNDSSTRWFTELERNAQILMPIVGGRIAFLDGDGQPINGNNKPQIMFYLAPFGSYVRITESVGIDEIYTNGKPKKATK